MTDADKIEQYRDRQLNKYLDSLEVSDSDLSNCCGAPIAPEGDMCEQCGEHCISIADEQEAARDDAADAKYEQMREER